MGATTTREPAVDTEVLAPRVELYLKVLFFIHLALLAIATTQAALGITVHGATPPTFQQHLVEWLATIGLGFVWWVMARRCPPASVIHAIDAVVPPLLGLLYIRLLVGSGITEASLFVLLLVSLALVLRAALVPSTLMRTLVVGALGVLISVAGAVRLDPAVEPIQLVWLVVFGSSFVAVTVVTSSVICDLRREVRAVTRLGQYEVTRKIGEGGMGVVYEATHVLLRRPTALKLLPVEKAGEEAVARFEREVRQTSRLEHPNNVSIFDYGRTPGGQFYYAWSISRGWILISWCGATARSMWPGSRTCSVRRPARWPRPTPRGWCIAT